jgi:uncharacterized peroxidase-related enzyme
MAHISLPEGLPGIIGPMTAYPDTAKHLNELAESLLRESGSLTPAERETIATFVSSGNECHFCMSSHAAVARHLLEKKSDIVDQVIKDYRNADISEKMKALLAIADKVRKDARTVTAEDIAKARSLGADDRAIHDTVLISAAFCMFNRYVDGLATWAPRDTGSYEKIGAMLATHGYRNAIPKN